MGPLVYNNRKPSYPADGEISPSYVSSGGGSGDRKLNSSFRVRLSVCTPAPLFAKYMPGWADNKTLDFCLWENCLNNNGEVREIIRE